MYLPVAISGYTMLGIQVPNNILLYRGGFTAIAVKIAIIFEVINLLGSFIITFNPIALILEEIFAVPPSKLDKILRFFVST